MAQENILREHLFNTIIDKVSTEGDRRADALTEFFAVTGAVGDARAEKVAELVPPILPELYTKWIKMFLDRLFETVATEQIELICSGTEEDNAAATLAYIMFLESERMEKQIEDDLKAYGLTHTGENDMGDLAAQYIRGAMGKVAEATNAQKEAKAEAYKRKQRRKRAKK